MKCTLTTSLAALVIAGSMTTLPVTVSAQSTGDNVDCVRTPEAYIPAGTLAMMAYRGALEKEGIPGSQKLQLEFRTGKITAEKIVQAAVMGCILSNKYGLADHENYVSDVKKELQALMRIGL